MLYAATTAHAKGMKVIGLTGAKSSKLEQMSDICIKVPQTETYMIQESSNNSRYTAVEHGNVLLATLYNAPVTVDSYYSAQVRHEFGWGGRVDKN